VYPIHVSGVAASPQFIMIKDSVFWGAIIPLDYVFSFWSKWSSPPTGSLTVEVQDQFLAFVWGQQRLKLNSFQPIVGS
jgi:hypothetical protein